MTSPGFFEYVYLDNSIQAYLNAVLIAIAGFVAIKFVENKLIRRFEKIVKKTPSPFDDFIVGVSRDILLPLLYFLIAYTALKSLKVSAQIARVLDHVILGAIIYFGVKAGMAFVAFAFRMYLQKREADRALLLGFQGILIVIKITAWCGAVIFFLDNMGFKVSALITGLGVGGVAVALAAQSIFKDLFGYFFILFDQPFRVGDFVVINNFMGTVENIGIKTTRIRSLSGEILVFPNSSLTDSALSNYKLMKHRRVEFKFTVDFNTSYDRLKEVPQIIKNIFTVIKDASLDRVHHGSFGDFGMNYVVAYHVLTEDYNRYMDIQQEINFSIIEEFAKRDIHFASRTNLFIEENSKEK